MSEETKALFRKVPFTLRVVASILVAVSLAVLVSCLGGSGGGTASPAQIALHQSAKPAGSVAKQDSVAPRARVIATYGRFPLSFDANQGQTDARVRFLARGGGYTIFLTEDEAVLTLRKSRPGPQRAKLAELLGSETLRFGE